MIVLGKEYTIDEAVELRNALNDEIIKHYQSLDEKEKADKHGLTLSEYQNHLKNFQHD